MYIEGFKKEACMIHYGFPGVFHPTNIFGEHQKMVSQLV